MTTFKKKLLVSLLLPFSLYASWGDADKLSDGSCKFEKESGYATSLLYTKGTEAYVIVDTVDTRYGTTSVVYNAHTCEKITSGSKYKSNFEELMERKGFRLASLRSGQNIDKSFETKINYSQDSDSASIKVAKIDSSITKELAGILAPLASKKVKSASIMPSAQKLAHTSEFKNAFQQKINNISDSRFNYTYALSLNKKIGNYSDVKHSIFKKYLHYKVKKVSNLPRWAKDMKRFGASSYISKLKYEIMNVPGFGNHLTINNFLSSNEYKYALQYLSASISKIKDQSTYGIVLNYGAKKIKLTKSAQCSFIKTSQSEFSCGFMWASTCVGTYKHYKCRANTSMLAKIERKIAGNTKVASSLKGGWRYNYMSSRYTKASAGSDFYVQVEAECIAGFSPCIEKDLHISGTPGRFEPSYNHAYTGTIYKGYNGGITGRYSYSVTFDNRICSGSFYLSGRKKNYSIKLGRDCHDNGSGEW